MSNVEPTLTSAECKTILADAKAPHVTEEGIKAKIKDVEYLYKKLITICIITMKNDFVVMGMTAPANAENYNVEIGKRYAYDNAFRQLWQLEGYLFRETINEDLGGCA